MEKPVKKREKLEIIVDSCCAGDKVFAGVDKLLDYLVDPPREKRRVFDDYQIIIPIQIGTETRRRIFPEILEAEIRAKAAFMHGTGKSAGALEDLVLKHSFGDEDRAPHDKHVRIVENEVSRAYKLFYGAKAQALLNSNRELVANIANASNALMKRYDFEGEHIRPRDVRKLCHDLSHAYAKHQKDTAEAERKIRMNHSKIIQHICEKTGITEDMIDAKKLRQLDVELKNTLLDATLENLARCGKKLFNEFSNESRCILQALYSTPELYKPISQSPEFRPISRDQGERSIDRLLMGKRSKADDSRVTLVISKDKGALNSIEDIRKSSGRTIIALNPYGFALALKDLGIINNLSEVVESDLLQTVETLRASEQRTDRYGRTHTLGQNSVALQEKWGARFAEVVDFGYYTKDTPSKRYPIQK